MNSPNGERPEADLIQQLSEKTDLLFSTMDIFGRMAAAAENGHYDPNPAGNRDRGESW